MKFDTVLHNHYSSDYNICNFSYFLRFYKMKKKYSFLTKVYDSKDMGYSYIVKVFKIDYDIFEELE